jgi:hypothetical protein
VDTTIDLPRLLLLLWATLPGLEMPIEGFGFLHFVEGFERVEDLSGKVYLDRKEITA